MTNAARFTRAVEGFFVRWRPYLGYLHFAFFIYFLILMFLPLFTDEAVMGDTPFSNFALFSNYIMWGLWFPLVLLSVVFTGRSWCGLLCPMGAASEWASARGLKRSTPWWLRSEWTPHVSFLIITVLGQTIGVLFAGTVPLVGIMFSNIVMGVTNYLAYKYEMTQALSSWLVGHFSTVIRGRYELVWLTVPLVILAFVFANHFNIVGMGKDFSQNLGVPYDLVLFMGLTIAAMITASVVVVVGSISYIGLIVPNIVAMFKGDQIRGTLVDTALFGAVFVLVCDMIGRVVIYPYELPIELIVGVIGSILFVGLLLYRLRHGRKAVRLGKAAKKTGGAA